MINKELKDYIDKQVLTVYKDNIGGHGIDHIKQVIDRSLEIVENFKLDVNLDMVYTIAAFHDISYKEDPDRHEELSALYFLNDEGIKEFFSDEERQVIYEAIIDHRASLEYEARSIYGKIVSSADREISADNMLKRSYLFQRDKHASENPSQEEIIEYSYKKLSSKYGKSGYAKMYYPDQKYLDFLDEMQSLIENKNKFVEREKTLAKTLK